MRGVINADPGEEERTLAAAALRARLDLEVNSF